MIQPVAYSHPGQLKYNVLWSYVCHQRVQEQTTQKQQQQRHKQRQYQQQEYQQQYWQEQQHREQQYQHQKYKQHHRVPTIQANAQAAGWWLQLGSEAQLYVLMTQLWVAAPVHCVQPYLHLTCCMANFVLAAVAAAASSQAFIATVKLAVVKHYNLITPLRKDLCISDLALEALVDDFSYSGKLYAVLLKCIESPMHAQLRIKNEEGTVLTFVPVLSRSKRQYVAKESTEQQ